MYLGEPKMKKHFTLILILSQLISALSFTGCQNTAPDPTTTTVSTEPESTLPETTRDSLPDDLNYGGQTVTIFAASDLPIVEFDAEQTGDIVDDAIYQRNVTVSERLNVDLNYIMQPGLWADQDSYKGAIRGCVLSGDAEYDIVAGYGVFIADLAVEQLFLNLNDTAYIDFDQKWWSDSLVKNLSLNGKLYFASGDISTNTIGTSFAVFFNKDLAEKYKLENLYSLVDNGKWTLDKLFELSSEIYSDLNGDGKRDENDQYGLVSHQTSFDNLYYSCGMNVVTPDKDKGMKVSPDFGSEKMASLVEKLCTAFNHTDGISWYTEGGGEAVGEFQERQFALSSGGTRCGKQFAQRREFQLRRASYAQVGRSAGKLPVYHYLYRLALRDSAHCEGRGYVLGGRRSVGYRGLLYGRAGILRDRAENKILLRRRFGKNVRHYPRFAQLRLRTGLFDWRT